MITPFKPPAPPMTAITQDELQALVPSAELIMRAALMHGQHLRFENVINGIRITLIVSMAKEDEPG